MLALAIIAVGLLVAATVAGVWVIKRARGYHGVSLMEDRGWAAEGLDRPDGPDLDGDGRPNDVHWQSWEFPLIVELSPRLPALWARKIGEAVMEVNNVAHRQVLRAPVTASEAAETAVEVQGERPIRRTIYVMGDEGTAAAKGHTDFYSWPDGRLYSARIQCPEDLTDPRKVYVVAIHELLHAGLGIDHSDDPKSVMYPRVQDRQQHLTTHDTAFIQRVSGRTA